MGSLHAQKDNTLGIQADIDELNRYEQSAGAQYSSTAKMPKSKTILAIKEVFKVKRNGAGKVERHRVKYTARGDLEQLYIDFTMRTSSRLSQDMKA